MVESRVVFDLDEVSIVFSLIRNLDLNSVVIETADDEMQEEAMRVIYKIKSLKKGDSFFIRQGVQSAKED